MKELKLIIIFFCFHWLAITAQTTNATGTTTSPVKKSTKAETTKPKIKYVVSGEVTQSLQYCGGMRPSEEMLAERKTPRPYVNKKFHIRKGNKNSLASPVLLSFTADSNGYFSIDLPAGIYSIIQTEQVKKLDLNKYKSYHIKVDEQCLKTWWAEPYYVLEIKNENITGLKFHFENRCFIEGDVPCRRYTGPLPP